MNTRTKMETAYSYRELLFRKYEKLSNQHYNTISSGDIKQLKDLTIKVLHELEDENTRIHTLRNREAVKYYETTVTGAKLFCITSLIGVGFSAYFLPIWFTVGVVTLGAVWLFSGD